MQCLSVLDVLLTLAQYSRCGDGALCRPEFVLPNEDSEVGQSISGKNIEVINYLNYLAPVINTVFSRFSTRAGSGWEFFF